MQINMIPSTWQSHIHKNETFKASIHMYRVLKLFIVFIFSSTMQSCIWMTEEGEDHDITIINNSMKVICLENLKGNIGVSDTLLDPQFVNGLKSVLMVSDFWVKPNMHKVINMDITDLKDGYFTHGIFIFMDKKILEEYSTEEIVEKQMKLCAKAYTLRQLDSLNWTITYP